MILCRELLDEMPEDDETRKYLEYFDMSIYCFPDVDDPDQRLMIRTIGFAENVIRDIKYEEPDYVKLANIRREALTNLKNNPNLTGLLSLFVVSNAFQSRWIIS